MTTSNRILGRTAKKDKYKTEQNEILNRLNSLLGMSEEKQEFYLYDLESSKNGVHEILDMLDDIKKYYKARHTGVFYHHENLLRPHIAIIKAVYKDMGYTITTSYKRIKRNGISIRTALYTFTIKTDEN